MYFHFIIIIIIDGDDDIDSMKKFGDKEYNMNNKLYNYHSRH